MSPPACTNRFMQVKDLIRQAGAPFLEGAKRINPSRDRCGPFLEGMAAYRINLWTFINVTYFK